MEALADRFSGMNVLDLSGSDSEDDLAFSFSLVGKSFAGRSINLSAMMKVFGRIWGCKEVPEVRVAGKNLFIFNFGDEEDRSSVFERSPWNFDGAIIVLRFFEPGMIPRDLDFSFCPFWIHIRGLPPSYVTSRRLEKIGDLIGTVLGVDLSPSSGLVLRGGRVRIEVDITKPLLPGIWMSRKGFDPFWIDFRYEKLPLMCFICGTLDHVTRSCRKKSGADGDTGPLFGIWLKFEERRGTPMEVKQWFRGIMKTSGDVGDQCFEKDSGLSKGESSNWPPWIADDSKLKKVGENIANPTRLLMEDKRGKSVQDIVEVAINVPDTTIATVLGENVDPNLEFGGVAFSSKRRLASKKVTQNFLKLKGQIGKKRGRSVGSNVDVGDSFNSDEKDGAMMFMNGLFASSEVHADVCNVTGSVDQPRHEK